VGTNFYLTPNPPSCPHCGRPFERLHIGKSSGGWCFGLHVIPEEGITNLDDWKRLFADPKRMIVDEYGTTMSVEAMVGSITERASSGKHKWTAAEYAENHAVPGLNGLARSRVDGQHCVGHGAGTWDLIAGEFS
jgi:hypothetical protein